MSQSGIVEDLEYLREMAAAGQKAPLLGGRFLAWWGGVITLAYACHYSILKGWLASGPEALGIMWLAVIAIGLAGYFALVWLMPAKPGLSSAGNRVMATVWSAGGYAIMAFFAGLIVSQFLSANTLHPDASLPLVFAVYALSLITTGTLSDDRLLHLSGIAALVFVALTVAFQAQAELYLVGAFGVVITVFLPGVALLRREPATVI